MIKYPEEIRTDHIERQLRLVNGSTISFADTGDESDQGNSCVYFMCDLNDGALYQFNGINVEKISSSLTKKV